MRSFHVPALLLTFLLLAGGAPATAPAPPEESALPLETEEEYERYYIAEADATLLLPNSWSGNYAVETIPGRTGFLFVQKDFLGGEWGTREDGTEGPIPDPEGRHVVLASFDTEEKDDYLGTFGKIGGHNGLWLGERDGLYYLIWFPTSFSSGDTENAEEKYERFRTMTSDLEAYPADASEYFIFD